MRPGSIKYAPLTGLLAYLAILLIAFAIYRPGLNSGFLLDDYPNISPVTVLQSPDAGLAEWREFLASGVAGPTGRPLSLATFGLQQEAWPHNPGQFKLVNFWLHAIAGLLVFGIVYRLIKIFRPEYNAGFSAFVAASIWLLLPVHVSTVLYVVQRMTILSNIFVLAGILFYLNCRTSTTRHAPLRATVGLAFLGTCALLSKESGIALLWLIVLLECTLSSRRIPDQRWRRSVWPILTGTTVATLLAFAWMLPRFLNGYSARDFTLLERLLTEANVLVEYLTIILMPEPRELSLFHDNYPLISTFPEAAPWLSIIAALLVGAIVLRKRFPLFSFGVLWYFLSHALEGTVVPLELYFEHRNYLPAVGIVIAVVDLALGMLTTVKNLKPRKIVAALTSLILIAFYIAGTAQTNLIWSNPVRQAVLWVDTAPQSLRAHQELTKVALQIKEYAFARKLIDEGNAKFPSAPNFGLFVITSRCESKEFPLPDQQDLVRRLVTSKSHDAAIENLNVPLSRFENNARCEYLDPKWLKQLLELWIDQEQDTAMLRKISLLLARTRYLVGDIKGAIQALHPVAEARADGRLFVVLAEWSHAAGDEELTRQYMRRAEETFQRSDPTTRERLDALKALIAEPIDVESAN